MNLELITSLVAIVMAITQALKKIIKVQDVGAVILSVIVSVLVVGWHFLYNDIPFEIFQFLSLVLSVIIASNGGYSLIKRMSGDK